VKYQALFDYVMGSEIPYTFILISGDEAYPTNIIMPTAGYAIPISTFAQSAAGATKPKAQVFEGEWWDKNIDNALRDLKSDYLFVFKQPYSVAKPAYSEGMEHFFYLTVGPAIVFSSREYAMGFAHGRSYNSVYDDGVVFDLMHNKTIKRVNKKGREDK
jgi:hypothetical protein